MAENIEYLFQSGGQAGGITSLTPFPFGKYKGRAVGEVMTDTSYVDWVLSQADICTKHPALTSYLRNGPAKEDSNTPVHNAMQVRYLDKTYCGHMVNLIHRNNKVALCSDKEKLIAKKQALSEVQTQLANAGSELPNKQYWKNVVSDYTDEIKMMERSILRTEKVIANPSVGISSVQFEWGNWDVLINGHICVELKPSISEDYPAIIRKVSQRSGHLYGCGHTCVVVTDRYTGTSGTLEQVKQMFAASNIRLLISSEFEPLPEWLRPMGASK